MKPIAITALIAATLTGSAALAMTPAEDPNVPQREITLDVAPVLQEVGELELSDTGSVYENQAKTYIGTEKSAQYVFSRADDGLANEYGSRVR
ncbi:MAG: hypothetical protein ACU0DK_11190 [Pseudooceanicola sp.]